MANPARGEVELPAPDGKTYTLFASTNAICEMEKRTGKTYGQVLGTLREIDLTSLTELLWAMLKKRHRREFTQVEAVGDLIDDIGLHTVQKALVELFVLNLPPKEAEVEPNGTGGVARPPEGGTGDSSISTPGPTA